MESVWSAKPKIFTGFSSSHVWMCKLDYEENWMLKNWCFWTVVLEKTLESPLDCREIQPVHPKGNQSWMFIGRTDVEAETPIFWPPIAKNQLIWEDPDAGNYEGRRRRGWQEGKMVMASQTQWTWVWVGSRSWWWTGGGIGCCSPWGHKELDMTERLNCKSLWLRWAAGLERDAFKNSVDAN